MTRDRALRHDEFLRLAWEASVVPYHGRARCRKNNIDPENCAETYFRTFPKCERILHRRFGIIIDNFRLLGFLDFDAIRPPLEIRGTTGIREGFDVGTHHNLRFDNYHLKERKY
jgi:hypothetical protein